MLGAFIPLRSNFGLELSLENHDAASGVTDGWVRRPKEQRIGIPQHPFSNEVERDEYRRVGEVGYMAERKAAALTWIRSHPARFAELCLVRARLFWFPSRTAFKRDTPLPVLRPVLAAAISLLALARLVLMFVRREPARWTMIAAIAGYAGVFVITHVNPRYAYPLFGLSLVLAADAALRTATWLRRVSRSACRQNAEFRRGSKCQTR